MSTTVDQRVVEMRFDNQHFERNVSTTLSTLDKLKQSLKLPDASKGLNSLSNAAKNVDMNSLGRGVEDVRMRFSALEVMGVTALANITNSAVNAGKRIVSALTIDPVKTGFQEYETQINAVQTILANTQSKGTSIDDVNRALDELNTYADKTIYNFTEMTRNIGTFTAAGVDLDTSVSAIQGIANLAAVSGSTSQQASTAMYQLSQALATGTVKLQDWNSVVNAGMGGEVFQNALVQTAAVMAGASEDVEAWRKKNIDSYGSFRDSLTQGEWLTTEVLTATLNQFTMAAEEGSKEWEKYKQSLMETGYTEKQAEEILKMANTATDAATKVKTFTQLWDVLKESAQSGWSQTWKLIIGDFEEAKSLLTPLADFLTGFVNKMSDFRNDILESALGRTFNSMGKTISDILAPASKATEAIKGTVDTITDLGEIVDKVIIGKFGNGKERFDALSKAGINYYEVQNKVNEKLNSGKRYTQEQIDAQNKLLGTQSKAAETTKKQAESTEKQAEATVALNDEQKKLLKKLGKMSDEQLRAAGYSEKQIKALNELKATAEDLGIPFGEFIDKLDEINGRWLLMNSFKNIGQGLVDVGKAIGQAWKDIFPEHNVENFANKLFNLLGALHKFSSGLTGIFYEQTGTNKAGEAIYELTDAGDKLVRTFKGVFAVLDIITTIVGGGLKIGFKVLTEILSYFNLGILDVTAIIGDVIVGFRDWLDSLINIPKILDKIVPVVKKVIGVIKDFAGAVKDSEGFEIATNIIKGLINGLKDGASAVWDAAVGMVKSLIEKVKAVLGIHSPSTEFITIGKNIIDGLILGIQNGASKLWESFKNIVLNIVDWVKDLDLGTILAGVFAVGLFSAFKKIGVLIDGFGGISEGIAGFLESTGGVIKSVSKVLNSMAMDFKADAVKKFAISIAILIGAISLLGYVCGREDVNMKKAVGVVAALSAILLAISAAMSLMAKADISLSKSGLQIKGLTASLISIGIAVLLMALTAKMIGDMDPATTEKSFKGLVGVILSLVGVLVACKLLTLGGTEGVNELGKTMRKIAVTMLLLVLVAKLIAGMTWGDMGKAAVGLGGLVVVISLLMLATSMAGPNVDKIGKTISKISVAMLLLVGVAKLIAGMTWGDMGKAAVGLMGLTGIIAALIIVSNLAGPNTARIGGTIMGIAAGIMIMALVARLLAEMDAESLDKGVTVVKKFAWIIAGLIFATKLAGPNAGKIGLTILSISIAIGILAVVATMLGMVKIANIAKGIIIVGLLSAMIAGMLIAARGVEEFKDTMTRMVIAIGILAVAAFALSYVDTKKLAASTLALSLVMGSFALMLKMANGLKVEMKPMILMMGVVTMLAGILLVMSKMKVGSSIRNAGAISMLLFALSGALVILDKVKVNNGIYKTVGALAVLGLVVLEFGYVLSLINKMDIGNAMPNIVALSVLMGAMSAVLVVLSLVGKNAKNALLGVVALTTMAIPLLAFVGVLVLMHNVQNATNNVKALIVLATALTLLLVPLSLVGALAKFALMGVVALTAMAIPLLAFVGVLALMSNIQNGIENAKALTELMGAIGDVLFKISLVAPLAIMGVGALAGMLGLITALGVVATAIGALIDKFPQLETFLDKGIGLFEEISYGLGNAIGSFIAGIGEGLTSSLPTIGQNIADFMDKLALASENASGIESGSFDGVADLISVMGDIALMTVGTSVSDLFTLGGTSMDKFETDGVAFFEAMKAISSAAAGITVNEDGMNTVIGIATKLADLQSSLEPIGGVIDWFTGRDDLATFGKNIGVFIGYMTTSFSSLDGVTFNTEALSSIIDASSELSKLQSSLEPIGGVISWFTGRDDLATFGINVGLFIVSMKTALSSLEEGLEFNTEALNAIISAATKLSELQSSLEPIGGVISWFTGRDDLGTFGENVGLFIGSMSTALSSMGDTTINTDTLTSIISAASKLAELQSTLEPMGGVIDWFTGRDDLGTFGENIATFASAMGKLKEGMGEDGISEAVVTSVTNAGNALIALNNALPEEGFFDSKITMTEFADYISDFSTAISDFSTKASEINSEGINTAITAAYRIKSLIASVADIDVSGVATFTGVGTGGFGADGPMSDIADAIVVFSNKVAEVDATAISTSVNTAMKLKNLINGLVDLDTSGIETFKKVKDIGGVIGDYADNVGEIDTATLSSSISAANRLKNFVNGLADIDTSGVSKFKIGTIGTSLKSYAGSVADVNSTAISSSVTTANKLKNFINSLADLDASGVGSFKTAISELGSVSIENIITAFSNSTTALTTVGSNLITAITNGMSAKQTALVTMVTTLVSSMHTSIMSKAALFLLAGSTLMTMLAAGMSAKKTAVATAAASSMSSAISSARSHYISFYNAGSYLVSGFANGISANSYKAAAKARAMAKAAKKAAEDALGIASPSKVFYKIGDYTGQGFVNALTDYADKSYSAGSEMATSARNGLNNAIGKITDLISGDMDIQPTIRPVLDLSDVESGANTISSILGSGTPVSVLSGVNAISAGMNRRSQNRDAGEIVAAINKLRKDLGNVGNTTYSINGVTYDDGSGITDAVKTIVRAAKIERRV